jgi:hypothetical protein
MTSWAQTNLVLPRRKTAANATKLNRDFEAWSIISFVIKSKKLVGCGGSISHSADRVNLSRQSQSFCEVL